MRNRRFRVPTLALTGVLAAASVNAGAAAEEGTVTERFEKTYPFRDGALLGLQNTTGGVEIESWDRDEVHLVAEKKVRADSDDKAREILKQVEVTAEPDEGGLRVATRLPGKDGNSAFWDSMTGDHAGISVSYRLQVPRRARLDVETANGGVQVKGTEGEATLETSNGGIEVIDVAGAVRASTSNGGIDVRLREVPSGSDLSFTTTNGGVDVSLPRDIRASLDVTTSNGRISSDFEVEGGEKSRSRLSGNVNGGGGQLKIRTSNGSVDIARH